MRGICSSRNGFSVIEVLVTASIMTVVGLVTLSLMDSQRKQIATSESKMGVLTLSLDVQAQIINNTVCLANLPNKSWTGGGLGGGSPTPALS